MIQSQRLSAQAVRATLEGKNLAQTLEGIWKKNPNLTQQQRGAVQDISYGVMRHYGETAFVLDRLVKRKPENPDVQALLLVFVYQILHTRAPSHAIVNNAVESCAKYGTGIRNFTNGVLRNLLRNKENILQEASEDLVAKFNYQKWWMEKVKEQYPHNWMEILEAGNLKPPMTLRVNLSRTSMEEYASMLRKEEIDCEVLAETAIRLQKPMNVERIPGFAEGLSSVQDFGAQFAAKLLDLRQGMRVLDACAAPGGKSAHMLESCKIDLLSMDSNASRLESIRQNFTRLGISGKVVEGDATRLETWWDGIPFQRILADVPCSASGVTKRHPDIKWLRRPQDVASFSETQLRIVETLWKTLENGGKLLYCTCSIFREENSELVSRFVDKTRNASLLALDDNIRNGQLLPNELHDGFFYAILQKN
ncbi:MAG: 16S rRNA (cytosine(967)-C(5))-methyltransferase RsmB [Burkholderiales bacterium]|nr:16S rRNA (cytosine(967)-C(5))-methyltransferase RsmB [Burkholderiales bacterium]